AISAASALSQWENTAWQFSEGEPVRDGQRVLSVFLTIGPRGQFQLFVTTEQMYANAEGETCVRITQEHSAGTLAVLAGGLSCHLRTGSFQVTDSCDLAADEQYAIAISHEWQVQAANTSGTWQEFTNGNYVRPLGAMVLKKCRTQACTSTY